MYIYNRYKTIRRSFKKFFQDTVVFLEKGKLSERMGHKTLEPTFICFKAGEYGSQLPKKEL